MEGSEIRQQIIAAMALRSGPQKSWDDETRVFEAECSDYLEEPGVERDLSVFEQIDRGEWPIEIEFAFDVFGSPRMKKLLAERGGDFGPSPPPAMFEGTMRLQRSEVVEMALKRLLVDLARRHSGVRGLMAVHWVDPDLFVQVGAEYFAVVLARATETPDEDALAHLIAHLAERNIEMVFALVERTERVEGRAGHRLRAMILDMVDDPQIADRLGLLTAATIRDRLDE